MHRFWPVVEELLRSTNARRICEIGADDGRHTRRLIEYCARSGSFLHVIDPEPKLEPGPWADDRPGVWSLHGEPSLKALEHLPPCDVYLVDGDHNWFTVTHELRLIHSRSKDLPLGPIVLLHDTSWPYGRRDLYYVPERIPPAFRQPYARGALRREAVGLCSRGMNGHLHNALREGEPRSGVLTAVEEHVTDRGGEVVAVHLPIWFGLTLLIPRLRLESEPLLSALVDRVRALSDFGLAEALEGERTDLLVANEAFAAELSDTKRRAAEGEGDRSARPPRALARSWGATAAAPTAPLAPYGDPTVRVDVVVTVHDALEDVERCLAALRRCTDGYDVRVLVVDDGSGPKTSERLHQHAADWAAITVLRHEKNLGYTRSVNAGLAASTAPWVVLLNSDTIVTSGWLVRLVRCAQSDPTIGLVGPLSNAASWQSVPDVKNEHGDFAVNALPPGLDEDAMARVVATAWNGSYPRLPVLNGFCLLLKREVIDKIGVMDVGHFPRGYGEENDYAFRAADAGFSLAVASDAFVYHAKSRSFGHAARIELARSGKKALTQKHGAPRLALTNDAVLGSSALRDARAAVVEALRLRAARELDPFSLRILFLLPIYGVSGGASSVIREAAELVGLGAFVRVAVPGERLGELGAAYADVPGIRELLIGPSLESLLELGKGFDAVVATVYYTMEWVTRMVAANPSTLPAYYVQDYEPFFFEEGADEARAAHASYRRDDRALLFAKSDWLVRTVHERHGARVSKVSPGLDSATFYPGPHRPAASVRVVAMIRPQTPRRGAARTMRVLTELARRLGGGLDVHVFGCPPSDPRFKSLAGDFPLTAHGLLRRPEVAELLRSSDVFLDLSDYQAFGRTSLEAMSCGCVPVVPLAGGGDEFARDRVNALVVDTRDESTCVERVEALLRSRELLEPMRRAALATASQFSLRSAALSELHVIADATRAWRVANRPAVRRRLILARFKGFEPPWWEASATTGTWMGPSVHQGWSVSLADGLPKAGSADVAVIFVDALSCAWDVLAAWLRTWRAAGGKVVVHVGGMGRTAPESSAGMQKAAGGLRWLALSCDAVVASSDEVSRVAARFDVDVQSVSPVLDPIVWRLGPAARRLARTRGDEQPVRIGLLGHAPSSELGAVLNHAAFALQCAYGDRISLERCDAPRLGWNVKKTGPAPNAGDSARADWAFGNIGWDIALIPSLEPASMGGPGDGRLLVCSALGAALVGSQGSAAQESGRTRWAMPVGAKASDWRDAIAELVEDAKLRESLGYEARSRLDEEYAFVESGRAAASLLARVADAAPVAVADLPSDLRASGRRLLLPLSTYMAKSDAVARAFPAPRSPMGRKLAKLRRDPAAFFRDAKLKPLRLLGGLFE